jgi:hypothetical protein
MAVNNLNTGVGIQPTIVDAKGDLIAATANDAVNRLAVGTNGQVLVADSGETTGLKWNDPGTVGGLVHIETQTMTEKIYIGINDKKIELKGAELEAFLEQQAKDQEEARLLEAEQLAKEAAKASAMNKLATLGLTDEEISALIQ